ncbi:hypothetical protein [Nostoc sp.]|uniref:hypothetical protein n=1 Tax=Nostoc sp. TaxID=1180 RepID=UPI002FFD23D7
MAQDFLDRLVSIFQNAIASIQENDRLKAENARLNTTLADLQTKFDAVTASLDADEHEIADNATKLASLQQIVEQFEAASNPTTPVAA